MSKKVIIVLGCIILFVLIYAWYAHASIYWKLGEYNVRAPEDYSKSNYLIGQQGKLPLKYVAIGDSLTAGVGVTSYVDAYPYRIAQSLTAIKNQDIDLVPYAIPGIRSEYVLNYFVDPIVESKPDIITVFIGINDIHGNVPNKKFAENYDQIISRLVADTDAKVYAVNLPYIGTKDLIDAPYRFYFNWKTKQFNEIIQTIALKHEVAYVDLYTAHTENAMNTDFYASDFFHPNEMGYTRWAEVIYASLNH